MTLFGIRINYALLDVACDNVDDEEEDVSGKDITNGGGGTLTTAGGFTFFAGSALLCASFINFEASACRLSICFWVVSKILDSTMTSYNLTPFT